MAVLVSKTIAVFDDSFQPTGAIHMQGINPHIEMKKLRHELSLTVEGPDDLKDAVAGCLKQAAVAAALTAVVAAFSGVGISATSAAWSIFETSFIGCTGHQVTARIDDKSHWITWDS